MSEMSREMEQREAAQKATDDTESRIARASQPALGAVGRPPQRAEKREPSAALQRTATAIRTMVPLLQKLLPLLDGNVASAVANLLLSRPAGAPAVDLEPLETALMHVRGDLAVMQDKSIQQETALKRIDDQLGTVKEALERAALEQKEAAEELSQTRRSVRIFAVLGAVLLVISIGLNATLFLYVRGILR
jgi:hypothetical protein